MIMATGPNADTADASSWRDRLRGVVPVGIPWRIRLAREASARFHVRIDVHE
jgi:hypothetical protein